MRSKTLPSLLRAACWLQSSGLLSECGPEALHDEATQRSIHELAQLMGFDVHRRLGLASCLGCSTYSLVRPALFHRVYWAQWISEASHAITFACGWRLVKTQELAQLQRTEMEQQVYHASRFGTQDRRVADNTLDD